MPEQYGARSNIIFVGVVAFAFALAACGNAGDPVSGQNAGGTSAAGGGSGGGGAGQTTPGTPLVWDATGFVAAGTNPFGIQGPFYFYSDCDPPSGLPCTMPDATLIGADAKPGWSV